MQPLDTTRIGSKKQLPVCSCLSPCRHIFSLVGHLTFRCLNESFQGFYFIMLFQIAILLLSVNPSENRRFIKQKSVHFLNFLLQKFKESHIWSHIWSYISLLMSHTWNHICYHIQNIKKVVYEPLIFHIWTYIWSHIYVIYI